MERCYLVHINLGGKPSEKRITETGMAIKKLLGDLSPDHHLAYTSKDMTAFGIFIKSDLAAYRVVNRVISPGANSSHLRGRVIPSPLRFEDSVMVLEIGQENHGTENTRSPTWLELHHPKSNLASKFAAASSVTSSPSQLASQLAEIKGKFGKNRA